MKPPPPQRQLLERIYSPKGCLATGDVSLYEKDRFDITEYSPEQDEKSRYIKIERNRTKDGFFHFFERRGKCADTPEEALRMASQLRDKKIKSLEKQLEKLKGMEFRIKKVE